MREHGTLHIPDVRAQNDFPTLGSVSGLRTFLAVPLRQQGELIGVLGARRIEVRPFTPAQIKLLETFADQAVIAIENVRLFQELKESLEQQTATSEILGVIASSPTDIQPVLDVVAENAARLCDANDALIYRESRSDYARPGRSAIGAITRSSRGSNRHQPWIGSRPGHDRPANDSHSRCPGRDANEFPEARPRNKLLGSRTCSCHAVAA